MDPSRNVRMSAMGATDIALNPEHERGAEIDWLAIEKTGRSAPKLKLAGARVALVGFQVE